MKLKCTCTYGLRVDALDRTVEPGEEFEVEDRKVYDDLARLEGKFEPVVAPRRFDRVEREEK